jgi:hypothetical protein
MSELQRRPILRSSDGTYARASQLIILTRVFRDDVGAPLIPEAHLPRGFYYLSSDYIPIMIGMGSFFAASACAK